jgi:hypothetical protein
VQTEILEKYPSAKVHVYAIWFSMLPTDGRAGWALTSRVIADPRVQHFWDEKRLVGHWYAAMENRGESDSGIAWDAYYLYGPDAQWNAQPDPLLSSGNPVRNQFDELRRSLVPMLR